MRRKTTQLEYDEMHFIDAMRELMRVCLTCKESGIALTPQDIFDCGQHLALAQKLRRAIINQDLGETIDAYYHTANRLYNEAYNEAIQAVDDTAVVAVECLLAVQDCDFEKAQSHLRRLGRKGAIEYHDFLEYALGNVQADAFEEENRVIMQ